MINQQKNIKKKRNENASDAPFQSANKQIIAVEKMQSKAETVNAD